MGARIAPIVAAIALAVAGCATNEWERLDLEDEIEAEEAPDGETLPGVYAGDEGDEEHLDDLDAGYEAGDEVEDGGVEPLEAGTDEAFGPEGGATDGGLLGDADERETLNRGGDASPPDRQDGYRR